jgi:hypothetical protein
MIDRIKGSDEKAFGFKVTGRVSLEDVKEFEPLVRFAIDRRKKRPIALLADISEMGSVEFKARWEDLRFLSKYSEHISRVAIVGASKWEEVMGIIAGGTVLFTAETRYFHPEEINQAWHWVRTSSHANDVPLRPIYTGGIWKDYTEEFDI